MTTHFSFDEFKLVEDTTNITISSFNPLRFSHYMRFIFAPTLCFQFDYPTTESIRISYVVKRTIELVLCNLLLVQLAEENCFPTLIEAMKQFQSDYMSLLWTTLKFAIPTATLQFLCLYTVFYSYLNLAAELTKFADRRFQLDWWNYNGDLVQFWSKFNVPLHTYIKRHLQTTFEGLKQKKLRYQISYIVISTTLCGAIYELIYIGLFNQLTACPFLITWVNMPLLIASRSKLY